MKLHKLTLLFIVSFACSQTALDAQRITISSETGQILRFGIDAERLWHWHANNADKLAEVGVKELDSAFVRVAINCAYEREEGVKKPEAYGLIINMMTAMRKANPDIKFFASPRPLPQAYNKKETKAVFGEGKVPWTAYPGWITGLKQFGSTSFNVIKLTRYYADYLNFMHKHGFDIDYMDITNEKQLANANDMIYLRTNLPARLDKGVKMPLLIAPSTWNYKQGVKFLNFLDPKRGHDAGFDITATHNTGKGGTPEEFAKAARRLNKEAWNTEMHGWVGKNHMDDINNSEIFWRHIRAGFTGICTWLFYGSPRDVKPRDHPMIGSGKNSNEIERTTKYEIYKKVTNTVNLGNYVPSTSSSSSLLPTAMKKGGKMLVCVLNTSGGSVENAKVELPSKLQFASDIEATLWDEKTPSAGTDSTLTPSGNTFTFTAPPHSLHCFTFKISGGN